MSTRRGSNGATSMVAHQHRAIVNAGGLSGKDSSVLTRKNSLLIPIETAKNSESSEGDNSPTTGGSKDMTSKPKMTLPALQRLGTSISDLNESIEESVEVLKLRDWYSKAKQRHEEYRRVDITMKIGNEKASRLYYALHTLLYTSICSTKTESLEKYIRSKAPTFAKSVFDIVEWEPALTLAKVTRSMELNEQRNEISKNLSQAFNLLRSFGQEMSTLKSTVQTEADQLQQMLALSEKQIAQVTSKFIAKQDEMLNKLRLNAMTHHHDMRMEKEQREEFGQRCEQLIKERDDLHERWKQKTVEEEIATKRITELEHQMEDLQNKKEHSPTPIEVKTVIKEEISGQHQSRIEALEHQVSTIELEYQQQKQSFLLQIENLTANNALLQQQMVSSSMSEKPNLLDDLIRQVEDMRGQHAEAVQALKDMEIHRDELIAQLSTAKQTNIAAASTAMEVHQTEVNRLNESRTKLEESVQRMTSENAKLQTDHERVRTAWKEEVDSLRSQMISLTARSDNPTKANAEGIKEDIMTSMQKDHQAVNGRLEEQLDVLMQRNTAMMNDNESLNAKIRELEEKTALSSEVFQGLLEAEKAMTIELRAMLTEKDREISTLKNNAIVMLTPGLKSRRSQDGLLSGTESPTMPPLQINTDTDQSTRQTTIMPIAPSTVVTRSDHVVVSISRIDTKELRHVEQGFGILDRNDVYVKLMLGPNGKELKTVTRTDAGAKANFDYINDKNDQKSADEMKWVTTLDELSTSKLSWSVWDWNDPNAKEKRPDILVGNGREVALELKLIRDGGTELSETISLDNQPIFCEDSKKVSGKVTIVLNVKVVKEIETAVPGAGGSDKIGFSNGGSGKHVTDEETVELRIRVESLQQQLSALQDRHMKLLLLQKSPSASPRTSVSSPSTKTSQKQSGGLSLSYTAIEEQDEDEALAVATAAAVVGGGGGDPASAEGEEMTEEEKEREKQVKIINAQFSGWKNTVKKLRQTADKLEKERKQLSLANKELKLLLHQALDGDTKSPALSNLVVKRISKGRLITETDLLEFMAKYDEFASNEFRLNDTILDLKIKLEAQTLGENYGFRKQIDVLKENVAEMHKEIEQAKDVKRALFDLTNRHDEMQSFFYEQSRLLISKNQEIAMLKQEAKDRQTMRDAIFAKEFAARKEKKLKGETEGKSPQEDGLENSNHGATLNSSLIMRASSKLFGNAKINKNITSSSTLSDISAHGNSTHGNESEYGSKSEHGSTVPPPVGTGTGSRRGSANTVIFAGDGVPTSKETLGSSSPNVSGSGRTVNFAIAGGGGAGGEGTDTSGISRETSQSILKPQLFTIGETGELGDSTKESAAHHDEMSYFPEGSFGGVDGISQREKVTAKLAEALRRKRLREELAKHDNLKSLYLQKSLNGSSFSSEILAFNTKKPQKSHTLKSFKSYTNSDKGSS